MNSQIVLNDVTGILKVVPQTLGLSFLILLFGVILGSIFWRIQETNNHVVKGVYRGLLSYFRGVPLLIHLLVFYYGLPSVVKVFSDQFNWGIDTTHLNPIYAVVVSYTLYSACFLSEIIRGSFKSVGSDQLEAASALGYTHLQRFWAIWLPQALSDAVPKILNYYTLLIRQLSLAFLVSVVDIFAKAKLESAGNDRYIEAFCAAALVYWILCVILTAIFSRIEKYLRRYEGRQLA
ncbi:amino acid ABC transporter permease [Lentilactobacillus sunkii]|uniref:Amino acid ABC transporter permease n=1 Tax=Lentilactobacillus sunkii DSM 19904 TaxID=1423808 RepID=A0A0R1L7R6_9LACO|nr:amino acid ABC transporter permease [Lentilactobacillus sunkii]KRK88274.1 amino acid ABC transporter permease [Lentilactobacillus sunkii DSM 19904]